MPSADDSSRSLVGTPGKALAWILAVFTLIACLFAWLLVLPTYRARGWPEAECTIDHSEIVEKKDSDGAPSYHLKVRYSYRAGGRDYSSDRYAIVDTSSHAEKQTELLRLAPGNRVPCYYDPDDPGEAVLTREYIVSGWLLLLAGLPLFIIGVWIYFYRRQQWLEQSRPERERWQADEQRTRLVLHRRSRNPSRLLISSVTCVASASMSWLIRSMLLPVAEADTTASGDTRANLVVIAAFLGFVAAVALLWFGYSLLRAIGPRLRLVIDKSEAHLGDKLELRWQVHGAAAAVRNFRMSLRAREERAADAHDFHFAELCDISTHGSGPSGVVTIELPADSMHSFSAGDYHIVWLIHIEADVVRWPDMNTEFELQVMPHRVEQ